MKKLVFMLAFSIILFGCNKGKTSENKANTTNSQNVSTGKSETNTANKSGAGSQTQTTGEKIEKPIEIKFEPSGLPKGWEWIDTDNLYSATSYDTKNGVLSVKIPSGKDLFGETRTAPQLLKAVSGDFEIETRVKFDPKQDYQGAGLLIFSDGENYLRLERSFGGVGGGMSGIRFDRRSSKEGYEAISTPEKFPTEAKSVELKIIRKGKMFQAFWREDENGEWKQVGEYASDYPDTVKIGLIGVNTAQEITAEFAYIKLAPVGK